MLIAEVLSAMRKHPAVLLPLPLGEVDLRSKDGEGEAAEKSILTIKGVHHDLGYYGRYAR